MGIHKNIQGSLESYTYYKPCNSISKSFFVNMSSLLRGDPRIAPIGLQQEVVQKTDAYKTAADALKTRIYYVSQVVIFLIALTGLTIGLTVGFNKDEGMMTFA